MELELRIAGGDCIIERRRSLKRTDLPYCERPPSKEMRLGGRIGSSS